MGAPPLMFSVAQDDAVAVLDAFVQYAAVCRRQQITYPAVLLRLSVQLSGAVRSSQEQSTFALPDLDAKAGPVSAMVTYRDAAGLLAWSESTLRRRVREGLLEPVRAGRTVRLRRTDIDRLIEGDH